MTYLHPLTEQTEAGIAAEALVPTPQGLVAAGRLAPGQPVLTLDGRQVTVAAIGVAPPAPQGQLVIRQRVLGAKTDIAVAPGQLVLLRHMLVAALFGHRAALIRAEWLANGLQVLRQTEGGPLVTLRLAEAAVIAAGGLPVFAPADSAAELPFPELTGCDARCVGESGLFVRTRNEPVARGLVAIAL